MLCVNLTSRNNKIRIWLIRMCLRNLWTAISVTRPSIKTVMVHASNTNHGDDQRGSDGKSYLFTRPRQTEENSVSFLELI